MMRVIVVAVEVAAYAAAFCFIFRMLARSFRSIVTRELEAVWRRLEWLERDVDDRLSVDRVEIQRRGIQAKSLRKRVRRCEKALYINVDGTEGPEKEEDGDER